MPSYPRPPTSYIARPNSYPPPVPSNGSGMGGNIISPGMNYSEPRPAYNIPGVTVNPSTNKPKPTMLMEEERKKLLSEATKKCKLIM